METKRYATKASIMTLRDLATTYKQIFGKKKKMIPRIRKEPVYRLYYHQEGYYTVYRVYPITGWLNCVGEIRNGKCRYV